MSADQSLIDLRPGIWESTQSLREEEYSAVFVDTRVDGITRPPYFSLSRLLPVIQELVLLQSVCADHASYMYSVTATSPAIFEFLVLNIFERSR